MNSQIRFAVIGCGVISKFHINAINSIEDATLIGVFDAVSDACIVCARTNNVTAYQSYAKLLADPELDAVCICTPSYLHAEMAMQALSAKKHVLIEKPLALTLEDVDKISALADKLKLTVSVMSQLRYSQSVTLVKHALNNGALGRITRCDLYMKYYRPQAYYDTGVWRGTIKMDGGGALMNQGIHGVDLVLHFMESAISIYALSSTLARDIEVEDTLSAVVQWKNGAHGVIQASVADYPGFARRIEINGENGVIILEEDRIVKWEVCEDSAYRAYEQAPINEGNAASGHSDAAAISPLGHIAQIRNFIDAIRGEGVLRADCHEGRKALELVLSAYKSAQTKAVITLQKSHNH